MKKFLIFLLVFSTVTSCRSQTEEPTPNPALGGPCEGCEAIFEYGDQTLDPIDTLPAFAENEPRLKITGTVFQADAKTPAPNVILYIYHTNRKGIYETRGDEQGWAKRHGYIRGWIKTDASGRYSFYTFRPASYPNGREPQHIHITVKEPGKKEYYLDDFLFTDDPYLTSEIRNNRSNRGGSGIVTPKAEGDLFLVRRDIVLGRSIPHYE